MSENRLMSKNIVYPTPRLLSTKITKIIKVHSGDVSDFFAFLPVYPCGRRGIDFVQDQTKLYALALNHVLFY